MVSIEAAIFGAEGLTNLLWVDWDERLGDNYDELG